MTGCDTIHGMPEHDPEQTPEETPEHKRTLREKLHDHLVAAEVAAEESAGYGAATTAVEATEAAIDPEHELGEDDAAREEQDPAAAEQAPEH